MLFKAPHALNVRFRRAKLAKRGYLVGRWQGGRLVYPLGFCFRDFTGYAYLHLEVFTSWGAVSSFCGSVLSECSVYYTGYPVWNPQFYASPHLVSNPVRNSYIYMTAFDRTKWEINFYFLVIFRTMSAKIWLATSLACRTPPPSMAHIMMMPCQRRCTGCGPAPSSVDAGMSKMLLIWCTKPGDLDLPYKHVTNTRLFCSQPAPAHRRK